MEICNMNLITSRDNSIVKLVCQLHDSKSRKQHKKFIAEGLRVCQTLLHSSYTLVQLYSTDTQAAVVKEQLSTPLLTLVSENVMKKMSLSETPSGILAVFEIPEDPDPTYVTHGLVLAHLADPGNMGTLIRTAAAMNAKSIVCVEGVDPWNPKVVQASAGTIGLVTIFQWTWEQVIEHKRNLKLVALVVSNGIKPEEISSKRCLLVIGNESHGVPKRWLAQCDEQMTIAMPGGTESLNAAVAGSIALYEVFKS